MAFFCPNCHNIVLVHIESGVYFYCKTCNFKYKVKNKIYNKFDCKEYNKNIPLDAVDMNNKNMSKTQAICPKCTNDEAYFYSLQIRSADEPSTIFYVCVKCNYHWKE
ncbi:DNA-directed RNA polymerase III subunit RPC10, putative [Plasmodium malariae]|uniref:DNA-directed RNA polymerase subunit n=1 Tax=Plasmodium malariae TaxID=5858 RepID=A0A1A8XBC8_PLAMA|nr:DNA-directed RNA polymerase III subunit RPC10, putative [Plasmodium malariae]SBT01587.1 DNA-directed RNA polymerase III subunit RPC10, putative [Plasmodium malariae]SBT86564.1 DNA-directed RNA polymerase III subunit RPC10, putative [Plasmodium malariae]